MLKRVFDFFVFTSLFIACCAILMVYQAFLLFGVQFPLALYGFVFFGAVCSYNFHWFLTPPDIPGTSPKQQWNLANRRLHLLLSVAGGIGAAVCSVLLLEHWIWLCVTALLTFLYSAPMIPLRPFIWLRKIAIAKTIYLAFSWAHITASLPLLVQDSFAAEHGWYLANRFFFIYAICIVFDRRDVESDRKAGIRSLITWLSEKGVDRLFWATQFLVLVTTVVLTRWIAISEAILLLIPAIIMGLLYKSSKQNRSDYLYYFLLDGLMALSAPCLILLRFAR
ncbi:UbiA family prenyltransferase [Flavisolibacter sp. BT320]|nr:UbiA family prenyltransferase [Flavisolibacter longurius]